MVIFGKSRVREENANIKRNKVKKGKQCILLKYGQCRIGLDNSESVIGCRPRGRGRRLDAFIIPVQGTAADTIRLAVRDNPGGAQGGS